MKESYQLLCSAPGALLVVTPYGSLPERDPEAHCFLWAEWPVGRDREPRTWNTISALEAQLIFDKKSGKGWQHEPLPARRFASLEEIACRIKRKEIQME